MRLGRFLALAILFGASARAADAGTVASYRAEVAAPTADVASGIAGRIERIRVRDGQDVARGDALIELDDREARARVAAATSALAAKQAERVRAEAALTSAPPERRELARSALEIADAEVRLAQAKIEAAQIDVRRATITAPIRGTIALHAIAPGQAVQRAQALATITDLDAAWIDAVFVEAQSAAVAVGQSADVVVTVAPGRDVALHGTVDGVDRDGAALVHAVVDGGTPAATVGVHVKIRIEPRGRTVRPGMPASVAVHTP